jgi:N-acetylneuraminate synthase
MFHHFKIGSQSIGHRKLCLMAHTFIDAVAVAGANAGKFQTHIAAADSTAEEPWRIRFSLQDASHYDYWKHMQSTEEQWHDLKRHADERGLIFLSSPFFLRGRRTANPGTHSSNVRHKSYFIVVRSLTPSC